MRVFETAVLGPEHAAEHAALRRTRAPGRGARRARRPGSESHRAFLGGSRGPAAAGPPSEVGAWTAAPFALPNYAIHTVVLPTGKVLFWGRPPVPAGAGGVRPNTGEAALWSPWLGTGPGAFEEVDPPVVDVDGPGGQPPVKAPIFCSGQTLLPDGQVLAAGGNLIYGDTFPNDAYTGFAGLPMIFTFNPFTETWTRQPNMAGRALVSGPGTAAGRENRHPERARRGAARRGDDQHGRGLQPARRLSAVRGRSSRSRAPFAAGSACTRARLRSATT